MTHPIFTRARTDANGKVILPSDFNFQTLQPEWIGDDSWNDLMKAINAEPSSPGEAVLSAYRHLQLVEDMIAIWSDGSQQVPDLCETWLAHKWQNHADPLWNDLVAKAWQTKAESPPPFYFRPSLCLVSSLWLQSNGFAVCPPEPGDSLTFRENPPLILDTTGQPAWHVVYSD